MEKLADDSESVREVVRAAVGVGVELLCEPKLSSSQRKATYAELRRVGCVGRRR